MNRTDTLQLRAIIEQAHTRLNHPSVHGRHGLEVRFGRSMVGDATLSVVLGKRAIPLIRLKRERGLWVNSKGIDVRVKAALDAIEPDVRALDALLPHGVQRGIWNIVP